MPKLSEKPFGSLVSVVGLDSKGAVRQQMYIELSVQVKDLMIPFDVGVFRTAGYYRLGDGGGAVYRRVENNGHLTSADGAIWAISELQPNVRMFGARGSGDDDTLAIDAAHKYLQSEDYGFAKNGQHWDIPVPRLFFPPGHYVYKGHGLYQSAGSISISADPRTATIEIRSDVYFLTAGGHITHTHVHGLTFKGGKGAVRYTNTQQNVTCFHVFLDCEFLFYTECAIGNNSSDHPYLKVQRCRFYGSPKGETIGIAWGGYVDALCIENSSFLLNKYHLKIGPRLSGSISILQNDFLTFQSGIRSADIWIVPNQSDRFGVNAGSGFFISNNKFGNENSVASDIRLVIAREGEAIGGDRLTRHHESTWIPSGAYLSGLQLSNNRIDGIAGMTAPFIRCYINDFWRLSFDRNIISGGAYTYLCEFMGESQPDEEGYATRTWDVTANAHSAGVQSFSYGISNRVLGLYRDLYGSEQGSTGSLLAPACGDDVGYVSLAAVSDAEGFGVQEATKVPVVDALGGPARAAEITIRGAASLIFCQLGSVIADRITWVEVDLTKGQELSAPSVVVQVRNATSHAIALREKIALNPFWQTARIPFLMPVSSRPDQWQLQVFADGANSEKVLRFCIGRLKVYHARQAMTAGHLRTIGSGTWDGEHIVLGRHHLWVDAAGHLRIRNGSPTSDRDGDVVGFQPYRLGN